MAMKELFFKGALTIIRPLLLVEKKLIRKAAAQWELPLWDNPCPSAGISKRGEIMRDVEQLCAGHAMRRKNIYNGLGRWQLQTDTAKNALRRPDS
jgi:tRNA(Ile)-lysidine synthase TilS/MesJ